MADSCTPKLMVKLKDIGLVKLTFSTLLLIVELQLKVVASVGAGETVLLACCENIWLVYTAGMEFTAGEHTFSFPRRTQILPWVSLEEGWGRIGVSLFSLFASSGFSFLMTSLPCFASSVIISFPVFSEISDPPPPDSRPSTPSMSQSMFGGSM